MVPGVTTPTADPDDRPPAPGQHRRLADRYLQNGALVAQTYAEQDRLDPTRPTLGVLVAEALANAERVGAARVDARYSALLDRIAGVVDQRHTLAADRDRAAERARATGIGTVEAVERQWAAELRGQADAIRSVLDPAEQAEVAGRVQALRAARGEGQ